MKKNLVAISFFFILLISKVTSFTYVTKEWSQVIEFDFSKVPSDIKGSDGHRMQNFFIEGNYIYGCVRYKGKSGTHSDNAILQFNYPTSGKKATYTGKVMRILNAGHGETLTSYKGYIVMGVKAKNNTGKTLDNFFSIQIGIFKFNPGAEVDYTKITRISHVNEAKMKNGATVNMGTPNRVLASVSGNLLTMRITIDGAGYTWTTYDLSKINSFITAQSGSHLPCGDINKISGAYISSFSSGSVKKTGYESFQGMETIGSNLFISSGQGGIDGKVEPTRITVINRSTGSEVVGYVLKNGNISVNSVSYAIKNIETQGLHYKDGELYVLLDDTKTKIGIVKFKV